MNTSSLIRLLFAVTLLVTAIGCNTTHQITRKGSGNSYIRVATGGLSFEWGSDVDAAPQKQAAESSYSATHTMSIKPPVAP